jgi:chorismate synthase
MVKLVREARDAKDSLGGVITCMIHHVPTGIGEPVFDKVYTCLSQQ